MIPVPPQLIGFIASLAFLVVLAGGSYYKGVQSERTDWEAKAAVSKIEAMNQEAAWNESIARVRKQHEDEKAVVQSRLTTALNSLRDRPAVRLPEASRAACAGATGAELSRSDSEFLIREAARADSLAGDLRACVRYIETLRQK